MNSPTRLLNARHIQRLIARAIICGAMLTVPSCAIPRLRAPEAPPPLPESFNGMTTPENTAQLGIDEFFNDPTLTALIEQAMLGNRELKILNEEVQIARAEVVGRRGAYLPFIGFEGNAGLEKNSFFTPLGAAEEQLEYLPGRHFANPSPAIGGGLNLFWQLDIWRELRNARDAAIQRYIAAREKRDDFVTRLVAETAENYYKLMALDKRLETLDQTIALQEKSRESAKAKLEAGRGTELAVQRFLADVRKNQSEKLIVRQEIVQTENRINLLLNRFPQPVERASAGFLNMEIHPLSLGVPSQLLQLRPDIRQAESELAAAGLDVKVARAHFFPTVTITGNIGYEAFNPRYIFRPDALAYNLAGNLVAPLLNKRAIQGEYLGANARQLRAVYNYQLTVLNAFTEVVNRINKVENYSRSIDIKKQQLQALEASVDSATNLFQNARVEYVEVLLAQRDLMDARLVLIDTKQEQLAAIVNTYQALGGGVSAMVADQDPPLNAHLHTSPGFVSFWNMVHHEW